MFQVTKKIKKHQLHRELNEDEYEEVISQTESALKKNALEELTSIPGSNGSKLYEIPMFVIAAQSYRDQLHGDWDSKVDCPPLEMENLLEHCLRVVMDHLKKTSGN